MNPRLLPVLAVLAALVACSSAKPYATSVGALKAPATITVVAKSATVNVYKPVAGDPADRFTVAAMARKDEAPPAPPVIRPVPGGIVVRAPDPLAGLLVRAPENVNIVVRTDAGNIHITDVSGNVDARTGNGNVKVMVAGYASASAGKGNVDVTIGSDAWPGQLRFSSDDGDVTVYVPEIAKFRVRLHTDDGTIFTDFGLTGTSKGSNETIDAPVNGGGPRSIDIESHHGTVRLLRLAPQA